MTQPPALQFATIACTENSQRKYMKQIQRVLLIDDDDTTNYINERGLLKNDLAIQVDIVKDGEAALKYLQNPKSPLRLDLILLDIKMPGMDGFTFMEMYQQLEPKLKATKLFALTSSASLYDLHKLKDYPDVVDHLYKPLKEEVVVKAVIEHFSKQKTA